MLGPGLGNLLFPWARFVVATRRRGWSPLAPTWAQVKIGPLLRRERDARSYSDLFVTPSECVTGIKKQWLLRTATRVDERESIASSEEVGGARLVTFSGMDGFFAPFAHERELVREELLRITRPEHKQFSSLNHCIAVHVRLGDFRAASLQETIAADCNVRLPIEWYVSMVEQLRIATGAATPVKVFSDGSDEELAPLLLLSDCERVFFGSSIADMLAMSTAGVLVPSASTFSMWSSFLGAVPTVWFKGKSGHGIEDRDRSVECGYGEDLDPPFLRRAISALNTREDAASSLLMR